MWGSGTVNAEQWIMNDSFSGIELQRARFGAPQISPSPLQPLELEFQQGLHLYRHHQKPMGSYAEIAFLTDSGRIFERDEIEATFIERANELGADALVLQPPVKSIEAPQGWNLYDTFLFEAAVVIYR